MDLNKEILLCYATADDVPAESGLKGWITNFNKFLTTLLSQINRDVPKVTLVNESNFKSINFNDAGAVLAVTTSNLGKCTEFSQLLNNYGSEKRKEDKLISGGISSFFKILKGPYDPDVHFSEYIDLISYDFYLIDPLTGEPQEFTRFFGHEAERSYWMKLVDMAYDLNQLFVNQLRGSVEEENYPKEKTVYLASTGVDMVIQRDVIKRELMRHGYKVLPNHTLPKEAKSLERMVRDDLSKCRLSIHLIGEDYGYKPKGSELSIVDIQNRIASEHTFQVSEYNKKQDEKEPFSRLIWVSPDLKNVTERQKIFIEDLKGDAAALEEAEVLQITLQELKSIVREELVTGGRFKSRRGIQGLDTKKKDDDNTPLIYLIHDKRDGAQSKDIEKYLIAQGYKVVSPTYEGDLVDLRYIHQENLRRCDASIIFFGSSNEDWIKTKLQDLLKAPGFGRIKPLQAKAVYIQGEKEGVDLDQFEKNNAMVLGKNGSFSPDHLKPFINKLAKGS
jgi:hypothetical protein